ncbi:unnamed protein product [Rhizophagus irregularis]|nr:unnamed protein product [Rhizophagus irregularis]
MRQDRDKWQLVRDLTKEEMEEITKENNGYDFLKKMQMEYTAAFIKIIKITQNWKVIGYFSNQKMMENAVELAMSKNDLAKVWMVHNLKTVYKSGKSDQAKPSSKLPLKNSSPEVNVSLSQTPPNRIYMELVNMASRNYKIIYLQLRGTKKRRLIWRKRKLSI